MVTTGTADQQQTRTLNYCPLKGISDPSRGDSAIFCDGPLCEWWQGTPAKGCCAILSIARSLKPVVLDI